MILMNDFKAEPLALRLATLAAVQRVLESGWYVLGSEVSSFEQAWAERCGTQSAVGVANGMDAIEIALRGLDIGAGDEVITTSMTAFATVLAIVRAGAKPVLADIEPDTGLMSIGSVKHCLSETTKAIILVHIYGQVRNMPDWQDLCQSHGLALIEDCAQAHLATQGGSVAGSFGVAGAYSFYPTKNLGAIGDGGMLVTSSASLAERSRRLRNYGQSVRYEHPELGMNSRLDEIQAAILSVRLGWLDQFTQRRREIAKRYQSEIQTEQIVQLALPQEQTSHVYHLYVIKTEQRDQLQSHLLNKDIQTYIHYPIPIHKQIPCLGFTRDRLGLTQAEAHAKTCLSLPCHPAMTDDDVSLVIASINDFEEK
jgi:dTDP-4-amino-4,6-dideoxygalactose transaminase